MARATASRAFSFSPRRASAQARLYRALARSFVPFAASL